MKTLLGSATMPPLIDSHAHLDDSQFHADLPAVLERAQAAGVIGLVTVGTSLESSRASLSLAREHRQLAAAVGIHPNHAAQAAGTDWDEIVRLAGEPGVHAIGETGLDRHWHDTPFP